MKIAFLVGVPSNGGGERVQNMLIEEFHNLGHDVIIYSWEPTWAECIKDASQVLKILKYPPIGILGKIKAYKEFKRILHKDRPDRLVVFPLPLAEVAVFSAKSCNIPTILSERCDPYYLPKSLIHRCLRNIVYKISEGIVFQTEEVKQYFSKSIRNKGVVIQNPIIDDDLPIVDTINCKKEIVAVGRLSEEKNFEMLIRAFADIKDSLPGYSLKIYGTGILYDELQCLITSLSMDDHIFLLGKVDRIVDYICNADIFVLSSNHEGMPNALIEAMAMGLACISTDVRSGGTKALINNMENGILIPVGGIDELKTSLMLLVSNRELTLSMKRRAMQIRKTNAKEQIIPRWISYINDVS